MVNKSMYAVIHSKASISSTLFDNVCETVNVLSLLICLNDKAKDIVGIHIPRALNRNSKRKCAFKL